MNHLAHFALAEGDRALITGAFLGDWVKGRLTGDYPASVETGIKLHRAIDVFTDRHKDVSVCYRFFDPAFRRYAPIMTDVYFDFLLARHWSSFYSQPLEEFSQRTFAELLENVSLMSPAAKRVAESMAARNSIAGYGDTTFVKYAFEHLATRLKRSNPMTDAYLQCRDQHIPLEDCFMSFYPQLMTYCENWCAEHAARRVVR